MTALRRRKTTVMSDVSAGCFSCDDKVWVGSHAQANAARHHDHTGHTTWVLVNRTIRYGEPPPATIPAVENLTSKSGNSLHTRVRSSRAHRKVPITLATSGRT